MFDPFFNDEELQNPDFLGYFVDSSCLDIVGSGSGRAV